MIALALQNLDPNYEYRGSLTADNKKAFDDLVTISGNKPSWADVMQESGRLKSEHALQKKEDEDWNKYKKAKDDKGRNDWKALGKPTFI